MKNGFLTLTFFLISSFSFSQTDISGKTAKDYRQDGTMEVILGSAFTAGSAVILVQLSKGETPMNSIGGRLAGGVLLLGAGILILNSGIKDLKKAKAISLDVEAKKLESIGPIVHPLASAPGITFRWKF